MLKGSMKKLVIKKAVEQNTVVQNTVVQETVVQKTVMQRIVIQSLAILVLAFLFTGCSGKDISTSTIDDESNNPHEYENVEAELSDLNDSGENISKDEIELSIPDNCELYLKETWGFSGFDYAELYNAISSCKDADERILIAVCMDKYWSEQNLEEVDTNYDIEYSEYIWRKTINENDRYADENGDVLLPWISELTAIDRGVSDDTVYSEEEFKDRIKDLLFQDQNVLRKLAETSLDDDPIAPYEVADEWTDSYADQRAYERLWCFFEKGKDLGHVRPLTKMNVDGMSWEITDEDISGVIPYNKDKMGERTFAIENINWPDNYKKYQHGENLSSDVSFDLNEFEYNEYNAKYIEAKAFWGFYTSSSHYKYMILPNYNHCAVGVGSIDKNDKRHFMVSEEFYSLDSETCNYLYEDVVF